MDDLDDYPDPPADDCEHDNGACWYGPDFWVCDMCGETVDL